MRLGCKKCGGSKAKFIANDRSSTTDTIYINVNSATTRGQIHSQINMYKGILKIKPSLKYLINYAENPVYTQQQIEDMLNG